MIKSEETTIRPSHSPPLEMTCSRKAKGGLCQLFSTIVMYTYTIEHVIVTQGTKHTTTLESITEDKLRGTIIFITDDTINILGFDKRSK